jgi:two-component sensor histidine kinase
MSSMLKKGKRQQALKERKVQEKETKEVMDHFNKTLYSMNLVMSELVNDDTLTQENYQEKVSAITDFKFSEKQHGMLKRELFQDDSLDPTENAQ